MDCAEIADNVISYISLGAFALIFSIVAFYLIRNVIKVVWKKDDEEEQDEESVKVEDDKDGPR